MLHVASRPLAAVMSFACLMAAQPAAALTTPSWNGWKWARSGNLSISVGNNLSAAWQPYLAPALSAWSADPIIDMVATTGKSAPSTCNPVFGTVQICNSNYGFNGWLGYAYVWLQSGYIVQATVKLNDSYFASAKYNTTAWRQMTICQELGHTIGLAHNNEIRTDANNGTCMDYTNDPTGLKSNGPNANTGPSADDFAGLAAIYATPGGTQLTSTKPMTIASHGFWIEGYDDHDHETTGAVPEPSSWALLIAGFGLTGAVLRRRRLALA